MGRLSRILIVTLGLAVAGGVFGALAGALVLGVVLLVTGGYLGAEDFRFLQAAAAVGGALGIAIGPAGAWLFLRRVPLGVAVAWTTVGAVAGGFTGLFIGLLVNEAVELTLIGAVLGFVIAALILRRRTLPLPVPAVDTTEPPHN